MGELGFNKIFGAILAVGLAVLGIKEVSTIVFGGAHHGSSEYASEKDWAKKYFPGWETMIKETGAGGAVIEEIYDLGLLLLNADVAKGERSFKGKCASCHTIEEGGANGTGPALWDTMGAAKQSHDGFNYSGALANTEGDWSWERMDAWLENPSSYARGTSMAFAGLKRDDERANVLAYLAQYSTKTPPMPEPLPAVEETAEGEAVESVDAGMLETDPALATGEITVQDATPGESVEAIPAETADDVEATLEGEGNDVIEEVADPALEE